VTREGLKTAGIVSAAAIALASVFPVVTRAHAHAKETSDVYPLPPPEDVARLSMGYRSAVADILWAHVLVSQGLHTMERRRFENLFGLLDTINELDPTFREPYLMTEALVTFQTNETPEDEIIRAREVMERGAKNLPTDGSVWLVLGEFVAFIAPSYLKDPKVQDRWRTEGSQMLARAAELGGEDSRISWQALGGAGILNRMGERDAAIRLLRRTLAVTDDDELKADIQKRLLALLGEAQADRYKRRIAGFNDAWRRELPFVGKTTALLLGPPPQPEYCAGGAHADEPRCATTWNGWFERADGTSARDLLP
jgi:hypothetical protein